MNRNFSKLLAIIVLVFFSWTFAGVFQVAYAIDNLPQTSNNTHSSRTPKSEERFQKAIEEIGEILEDPVTDRETKASKVKAKKGEIEELDKEIRKQFAETEKKLREARLPDEILQRHHKFVKHYEDNLNELKANLDSIEKTKGLAVEVEIEKAKKHLQRVKPPKKHIPLDPNKLPHRTPKIEKREPRLKKEDFERDFPNPKKAQAQNKPILVASIGPLKGLLSSDSDSSSSDLLAQTSNQPTPADLAENIDIQFTPEIRAKAQELGYNPVKIYNWVRNNIEFVPTYGSIQGAHMTLLTKQGNAFDTASLLIALLRASNIPARYVYGTIEIPIDKVMNWVGGFTDPTSALDFIASGGIPVTGIISEGKVTKARIEHVWVEAWVDYVSSRGSRHKMGQGDTWILLDASFKQYKYKMGIDLFSSLSFNGKQFLQEYIGDPQDTLPYQYYSQQMFSWLDVHMPSATIEDIIGADDIDLTKTIYEQNFPYLLGTLPYRTIVEGGKYSEIPDVLRHKVSFEISEGILGGEGITITKNLPEISGKRVTLSYIPATANDEALVTQYGGSILNVPPYLLNVKPVIKIDGADVGTGGSFGMGSGQTLMVTFYDPAYGTDIIENTIIAGTYSAITIQAQKTPVEIVTQRMEMLRNNSKNIDSVTLDDLLGELLYDIGLSYFHHLTFENDLYAKTFQMVYAKGLSEAITTLNINVSYLFGIPISASQGGLNIDVDRNVLIPASITGDTNRIQQFMVISGMTSSAWEHRIFETFLNTPSVSAMKLLKYANQQGVPVYAIDSINIGQLLPAIQVSSEIKAEIQNAVTAGKKVIIPQTQLQYYEWSGLGYIVLDPATGAGAYRISGGLSGGGTAKILTKPPITLSKDSLEYQRLKEAFLNAIMKNAESLIGTPRVKGGKEPGTGFDCSGFTRYVLKMAGYEIPAGSAYQYKYFKENGMLFQTPQAGDLFFYQKDGNIYHTGIVSDVSDNYITIIDSVTEDESGKRVFEVDKRTINMETNSYWKSHIAGFGRIIE
jgi:DNA-binding transcriptional MerR regulator